MIDSLMYGPVEGETFSGVTGVVEPGGIGNITAFDGATFTAKWLERGRTLAELEQHDGVLSSEIQALKTANSEDFSIRVRYGSYYIAYTVPPADLPSWGFAYVSTNTGTDIIALTHQYSPSSTATKIANFYGPVNGEAELANKVYGSVSGQARIVHQAFGHLDYGYGTVTYYTDSSHTTTNTVTISTLTELDHLSGFYSQNRSSWNATVGNITISNKDIAGVTLTNKVTSLPPYFLCGCESFNSDLILPSSLTTIRTSGESTYGSAFILSCSNMTSAINVGDLDPSIVQAATNSCFAVSQNTDAAYVQGIKIAGANRSAWLTAFPNRSSRAPYRKLVDAGY